MPLTVYRHSARAKKIWHQGNLNSSARGPARVEVRGGFSDTRNQIRIGVTNVRECQTACAVEQHFVGSEA